MEALARRELQSLRYQVILIINVKVSFVPMENVYKLHFRICCLYRLETYPYGLANIEAVVEGRLSVALLELFGGELPFFVESVEGWMPS